MDETKIRDRIEHLKNFKIEAARSCGKPVYRIDWFEVSESVFEKYGIDEELCDDPFYIGCCIDFAIRELDRIIRI